MAYKSVENVGHRTHRKWQPSGPTGGCFCPTIGRDNPRHHSVRDDGGQFRPPSAKTPDARAILLHHGRQRIRSGGRVGLHEDTLIGVQLARLQENMVGQTNLANVVKRRNTPEVQQNLDQFDRQMQKPSLPLPPGNGYSVQFALDASHFLLPGTQPVWQAREAGHLGLERNRCPCHLGLAPVDG